MDFSKYGLKEGVINFLKVLGYVAVSAIITYLIGYVAQFQNDSTYAIVYVIVNPVLAFLKTWLETKAPKKK